jgi:membrane fusion protein (multidrug efflux system)
VLSLSVVQARAEVPVPVAVTTARMAAIAEEVALHGNLVAQRISRLSSETDGMVAAVNVDEGDVVESGAIVVRLDRRLATIERDAATARLQEARARATESARRHLELEALRKTLHVAETTVVAAHAQAEIDLARAKQAEAELERVREMLARHNIRAPFAAVVRRKLVEQGEWVETNSALLELVDIDVLRLEVPVPQFYFSEVDERTPVSIRMDALPDRLFEAHVTRKIPISDTASRTFRVRIDIPNRERALAPGMSARVVLKLGPADGRPVLVLPRDAVVRKPDGSVSIWVIETEDGVTKAVPRAIGTGRAYRDHVEIIEGNLFVGEKVVVRGNEILRAGQSVLVADDQSPEL